MTKGIGHLVGIEVTSNDLLIKLVNYYTTHGPQLGTVVMDYGLLDEHTNDYTKMR